MKAIVIALLGVVALAEAGGKMYFFMKIVR